MDLMKWFRRNKRKIMAVVIVILMIGFIGSAWLRNLAQRRGGGKQVVATYGEGKEITALDRLEASNELEILKLLRGDVLLRNLSQPMSRTPDLRSLLLAELLFSESSTSAQVAQLARRIAVRQNVAINPVQINDFYEDRYPADVYWLLLKEEAYEAGVRIPRMDAASQLNGLVPRLFEGASYGELVTMITQRMNVSEEKVIDTFGQLLGLVSYTRLVTTGENYTENEIRKTAKIQSSPLEAEYVKIPAGLFAEDVEVSDDEIQEHFDNYKDQLPKVTADNPFGFGYKLPELAAFEYMVVKYEDVAELIEEPTEKETEDFYQRNRDMFTEEVPEDPEDPNSPLIERTKGYAVVINDIIETIKRRRTEDRLELIMAEAKRLVESKLFELDEDVSELTDEEYRQLVGDYASAAESISEKYSVPVYVDRTGKLSVEDVMGDRDLSMFYEFGTGNNPVYLPQILFAIGGLDGSELGPFDIKTPRLYESIGPLKQVTNDLYMLARVIETQEEKVPELDTQISKNALRINENAEEKVYSVREDVAEDVRKLKAFEDLESKADEFVKLVEEEDGWDEGLAVFNERYGLELEMETKSSIRRYTAKDMLVYEVQSEGFPGVGVETRHIQAKLAERLVGLLPEGAITIVAPEVVDFKPEMSYYVLKALSVEPYFLEDYELQKGMVMLSESERQAQGLAFTLLNPENVVERNDFEFVLVEEEDAAAEEVTAEPNETE